MDHVDTPDCEFCTVDEFRVADVFLENEYCIYAANGFTRPDVLPGAGIAIPKAHRETPFELSDDEWAATRRVLLQAKTITDERLQPDGYNLIWNVYPDAGQVVAHVHLHVIPRFHDEPLAGRGGRWWLKQRDNRRPNPAAPGLGRASR